MEHIITTKNEKYICTNDVRDNEKVRKSFDDLSKKTFGLSFESWYQNGYWLSGYIPYVLIHNKAVVANISVNIMDMKYGSLKKRYTQLGTVMTDVSYRNQGLSRYLMNVVIEEWREKSDAIFLFANDTVLDFYPKFGFVKADEYQYFIPAPTTTIHKARKLNMLDAKDVDLLRKTAQLGNHFSRFELLNIDGMLMFYCSKFMQDSVYFSERYNTVIIAEYNNDHILCYDVFGNIESSLCDILSTVAENDTDKIVLGFTPQNTDGFEVNLLKEKNTTLFLLSEKENLFEQNKLMFPLLSHA